MSVWYSIPSARPVAEANVCLSRWRARGYRVAVQRDQERMSEQPSLDTDLTFYRPYRGYAESVNWLAKVVLRDPTVQIIVTGGDDIDPDPTHDPAVLEREFIEHFGGTFGVMQPTGHRYGIDAAGTCAAERVLLSPWFGRSYCERMYGGKGPLEDSYFAYYVDEEAHEVAKKLGVLWHRPDLTQEHRHWSLIGQRRPAFLAEAQRRWDESKNLFNLRRASGFPGHEPLADVAEVSDFEPVLCE